MTRHAFLGLLLLGAVPGCASRVASAPRRSRTVRRDAPRERPEARRGDGERRPETARGEPAPWRDRDG